MRRRLVSLVVATAALLLASCAGATGGAPPASHPAPTYDGPLRTFSSSFESVSDFSGFYIVPAADYASAQALSTQELHDGAHSFKAWILSARAPNNDGTTYLPHRAYPTVQLQKTADGIYRTPCLISLWVYLDILIDFDSTKGYAKVWQNGALVSHADIQGGNGGLAQAHFGLYSAADLASGTVYNDKLRIVDVASENAGVNLVKSPW